VARPNPTRPNPAQPGPVRPGPALRAPGAHTPLAPLLSSLSHLDFPRSNLSSPSLYLSLPWCPRVWRQESPELDPEVSPSPPLFSLSLLSPLRARARPCVAARPASPRGGARPLPSPSPARRGPCTGAAPAQRGPGAVRSPARPPLPPARSPSPLRAASRPSAWLAWPWHGLALPRLPLNEFPRA
jgi:hypothetical protein